MRFDSNTLPEMNCFSSGRELIQCLNKTNLVVAPFLCVGLDVWWSADDRHLFSRGPRVQEVDPLHFSGRHLQDRQPQQR